MAGKPRSPNWPPLPPRRRRDGLNPARADAGTVLRILVKAEERVEKGQPLAVMEAMKLQMTLSGGRHATVEAILVKEGEMVAEGAELVRLKEINMNTAFAIDLVDVSARDGLQKRRRP